MLYQLIVFLHVISAFAFLLSHGAAASVAFALKRERDPQKIRALLNLSMASYPLMGWSLVSTIVFGIIAGFQLNWWRFGWIWTSIVLLVVIVVFMGLFGAEVYGKARASTLKIIPSKSRTIPRRNRLAPSARTTSQSAGLAATSGLKFMGMP